MFATGGRARRLTGPTPVGELSPRSAWQSSPAHPISARQPFLAPAERARRIRFERRRKLGCSTSKGRLVVSADGSWKYCYPVKSGASVEAEVCKGWGEYTVKVSVPEGALPSKYGGPKLHWGIFRSGSKRWIHPQSVVPPNSVVHERTGVMRTLLQQASEGGHAVEFRIPADLAPITLAFTACTTTDNEDDLYMDLRRGLHCAVPVGMYPGSSVQLGPTVTPSHDGKSSINFAVASRTASSVALVLIRDNTAQGKTNSHLEIALDPVINKTGDVWHIKLDGLDVRNLYYGWRLEGDAGWEEGGRFCPSLVMLDPYSKHVGEVEMPESAQTSSSGRKTARLGRLDAPSDVKPEPHSAPRVPLEAMVVYELDVPAFTSSLEVPQHHRGKLMGVLDRLPHLKEMGVTSVVFSSLCVQLPGPGPLGRTALNYFAPEMSLSTDGTSQGASAELRQVVRALHEAGMEVLVQFDFCFTAEGTADNPDALSFRGIDNAMYYRLNGVLNCGQLLVRQMIRDVLRHWACEYCLDGFSVLNAETLCQDSNSTVLDSPQAAEALALDPVLRHLKLIACIGDKKLLPRNGERGFPHWGTWMQMNGQFADIACSYLSGVTGMASAFATAVSGSPDLFAARWDANLPGCLAAGRRPAFGINAFAPMVGSTTLLELASNACHVPAGTGSASPLYGTRVLPAAKALLVMQLLSQGVPTVSLSPADEADLRPFISKLMHLRHRYVDLLCPPEFDTPRSVQWHGAAAGSTPDWAGASQGEHGSKVMGLCVGGAGRDAVYVVFNPHDEAVAIAIPSSPSPSSLQGPGSWALAVDTSRAAPTDFPQPPEPLLASLSYILQPHSAAVMVSSKL